MSDKPIVDIADVTPGTSSVKARDLKRGYLVFDSFGGTYPLARDARVLKSGEVSFQREGYHTEYADADDDFTVVIPECTCPTWERADDFDGPEDYAAACDAADCPLHG